MCAVIPSDGNFGGIESLLQQLETAGYPSAVVYEKDPERPIFRAIKSSGLGNFHHQFVSFEHMSSCCVDRCALQKSPMLVHSELLASDSELCDRFANRAPLALVPLVTDKTVHGVLVVSSKPSNPLTGEDLELLRGKGPLFVTAVCGGQEEREFRNHEENRTSIGRLRSIMSHAKSLTALQAAVVDMVNKAFRAETCALLLPTLEGHGVWQVVAHRGMSEQMFQSSYYRPGTGLTGHALKAARDQIVTSDDIINDGRWSRQFEPLSAQRDFTTSGSLAFMGVPVYTKRSDDRPFAAIVCTRARESLGDANYFHRAEHELLKEIAVTVAEPLRVLWKRQNQRNRELAKMAESTLRMQRSIGGKDASRFNEHVLKGLKKQFGFERLLLALVNNDRTRIKGDCVIGFDRTLVDETDRPILVVPPERPEEEDILSLICREGRQEPIIILPDTKSDRYRVHVHAATAEKHRMNNAIVFIPLVGGMEQVIGVIHGEYPQHHSLSKEEKVLLKVFSNLLASFIERHRDDVSLREERRLNQQLFSSLTLADVESTLRQLLDGLYEWFGCYGLFYEYDDEKRLLQGRVATGIDEERLRTLSFSVNPAEVGSGKQGASLAEEVFLRRAMVFVSNPEASPVNQVTRDFLGLRATGLMGYPLSVGERLLGVLVLFSKAPEFPLRKEFESTIAPFATIGALAIAASRAAEAMRQHERELQIRSNIIRNIALIGTANQLGDAGRIKWDLGEIAFACRGDLQRILGEAVSLLKADCAALYLADEPVRIKSDAPAKPVDSVWLKDGTKFTMRGHFGYPSHYMNRDCYTPEMIALTASVLRAPNPMARISKDVESEGDWSHAHTEIHELGLRSWLGVPLLATADKCTYLLGCLTVTRRRHGKNDALFFAERDKRTTENMAAVLGLALYNQNVATLIRREVDRDRDTLLKAFTHTTQPLAVLRDYYLSYLGLYCAEQPRQEEALGYVKKAKDLLDLVMADFQGYYFLASRSLTWTMVDEPIKLEELIAMVLPASANHPDISFTSSVDPPAASCRTDRSKVIAILHQLIRNAVKAVDLVSRAEKSIDVKLSLIAGPCLILEVSDNGCGFGPEQQRLFGTVGNSGFASTGLGLAIVKGIVGMLPGGKFDCKGSPGEGSVFCITLPVEPSANSPENYTQL